jgi:hypothetical protein
VLSPDLRSAHTCLVQAGFPDPTGASGRCGVGRRRAWCGSARVSRGSPTRTSTSSIPTSPQRTALSLPRMILRLQSKW